MYKLAIFLRVYVPIIPLTTLTTAFWWTRYIYPLNLYNK